MKRNNAIVLVVVSIIIIVIGAGLYFGQKTGRLSLFAAFTGFSDVPSTDPAYTEITNVGQKGWMEGYSDGTFKPDTGATRAMVVVGEVRARGDFLIDPIDTCLDNMPSMWPFTDVPCDHWAYSYIYTAKNLRLIEGYPDKSFKPDNIATRAETVVMIMKALGFDPLSGGLDLSCTQNDPSTWAFPDVPCDYWAARYIREAKTRGIISGFASGNFEPDVSATRRDLAVMLYRAFVTQVNEKTITGTVKDSVTKAAIPGANVVVGDVNIAGSALSDSTDSTGAYQLTVSTSSQAIPVRATATGYQSATLTADLSGGNATLDFELVRNVAAESTVTGTIRDAESGKAIRGAEVTVLGYEDGSQLSDSSDSYGRYTLRIGATSGTFSVRVQAANYNSKTKSVTVYGGTSTLNFRLSQKEVPEPGQPTGGGGSGSINAARTGAILPISIVLIGTILALFSLAYLLRTGKKV